MYSSAKRLIPAARVAGGATFISGGVPKNANPQIAMTSTSVNKTTTGFGLLSVSVAAAGVPMGSAAGT